MSRKKKKNVIRIDEYSYNERELAQIIRRKMITTSVKNKKAYSRKEKHKGNRDNNSEPYFIFYITLVSLLNKSFTLALLNIGLTFSTNTCLPLNLNITSELDASNISSIRSVG